MKGYNVTLKNTVVDSITGLSRYKTKSEIFSDISSLINTNNLTVPAEIYDTSSDVYQYFITQVDNAILSKKNIVKIVVPKSVMQEEYNATGNSKATDKTGPTENKIEKEHGLPERGVY